MEQLYNAVDASKPVAMVPAGTQLVFGYTGEEGQGQPDTPYIWTAQNYNDCLEQNPQVRFLPIYVHNYDNGDPIGDADNGVNAILKLGWAPNMRGLLRRILVIDCEVLVDPAYFTAMQNRVFERGFQPVLYGSTWFVQQNPARFGYWFANPTGRKPASLTAPALGVQWFWGAAWNLSVLDPKLWLGAGEGPRKG